MKQREIKFRAKKATEEWAYFSLNQILTHNKEVPAWVYENPEIEKQISLGIHDYNEKEFYEGDFIEITIQPNNFNKKNFNILKPTKKRALIKWDEDNYCFNLEFDPGAQWHPCYEHIRLCDSDAVIVGNIFDNPVIEEFLNLEEFLKEKK